SAHAATVPRRTFSAKEVFKRFASNLVVVECETLDSGMSGSGFLVSREGHVITNAHVINNAVSIEIHRPGEPALRTRPMLVYVDVAADIAILKSDFRGGWFDLSSSSMPAVGERVYAIGNPEGYENTISDGIVSGIRYERNRYIIQHSAPLSHGSSGGVLI